MAESHQLVKLPNRWHDGGMYTSSGLGFNPFKTVASGIKTAGRGIATGAKAAGHGIKVAGQASLHFVLRPLRAVVDNVTSRRAKKLSWDRRKSLHPNRTEIAEAKNWTKNEFNKRGPQGQLIAHLAGSSVNDTPLNGAFGQDPATLSLIAASVGALTAVAAAVSKGLAKGGGAPADPRSAAELYAQKLLTASTSPTTQPTQMPGSKKAPTEEKIDQETAKQLVKAGDEAVEQASDGDASTMEGFALGYTSLDAYEDAAMLGAISPAPNTGMWVAFGLGLAAVGAGAWAATRR